MPSDQLLLAEQVREACELALHHSRLGIEGYLQHLVIDSRPEQRPYRQMAEPWQWALARTIAPAIERVAGLTHPPGSFGSRWHKRGFWFTLPRGHDKTGLIGRLVGWALAFSPRKLSCVAAAKDRDQANLITRSLKTEAELNPWLNDCLEFHNYKVTSKATGSALYTLTADAGSSFGEKSDIVVCDELTHWDQRPADQHRDNLWDVLISGKEKRPDSVYIVITNAGLLHSWQWDVLNQVKQDPDWFVYEAPGRIARWMDEAATERLAALIPELLVKRVLHNCWVDPSEGMGYVTREQAEGALKRGVARALCRQNNGRPGVRYFAGVDYGVTKDRTACCVLHCEPRNPWNPYAQAPRVTVDRMDVWQGSKANPVQVSQVEDWMEEIAALYPDVEFIVDPYQLLGTIQKFQHSLTVTPFEYRAGRGNYEMAVNLHALLKEDRLDWYPGCGDLEIADQVTRRVKAHTLVDEFSELVIKHMSYGYRFDHEANKHDDRVCALGMPALHAVRAEEKKLLVFSKSYF